MENQMGERGYKKEVYQSITMVMQFGINMLVPIFACTWFGCWLGEKVEINWLAVPFFFIGALSGGRNIFVLARKIYQPQGQKKEKAAAKKTQ